MRLSRSCWRSHTVAALSCSAREPPALNTAHADAGIRRCPDGRRSQRSRPRSHQFCARHQPRQARKQMGPYPSTAKLSRPLGTQGRHPFGQVSGRSRISTSRKYNGVPPAALAHGVAIAHKVCGPSTSGAHLALFPTAGMRGAETSAAVGRPGHAGSDLAPALKTPGSRCTSGAGTDRLPLACRRCASDGRARSNGPWRRRRTVPTGTATARSSRP